MVDESVGVCVQFGVLRCEGIAMARKAGNLVHGARDPGIVLLLAIYVLIESAT